MNYMLSKEEKERFLRAIEEDREFRYAMMGLLGMKELLERQQRLEEKFARLEERFARLEEKFAKLEERQQRLEEKFARLEERFARLEEEQREMRRVLTVIAHRFGVISEEAFRQGMKFVVEDALGAGSVEKWVYRDDEGIVYGYPSIIEVDVLVRDGTHILVEVKSRVSKGDVSELYRIGLLYKRVTGVEPRLLIVGGFIDRGAWDLAGKLGVELKPIITD